MTSIDQVAVSERQSGFFEKMDGQKSKLGGFQVRNWTIDFDFRSKDHPVFAQKTSHFGMVGRPHFETIHCDPPTDRSLILMIDQ